MIPNANRAISSIRALPAALTLFVCLAAPAFAVSPIRLSGALEGVVTDLAGKPQMGATVLLFNRQERLCERLVTNENGAFAFAGLVPDVYALHLVAIAAGRASDAR